MHRRFCRILLLMNVALWLVVPLVGVAVWLNLGRYLDASVTPAPVDAIIVMGGEGSRFMRTRHAVQLYAAGLAPRVVFSGGTLAGMGIACTSTELSVEAATGLGLPEEAIVLAPEAQSTLDEAANLQVLAAEHGWRSLLLVTDRFHTRRSLQTMRAYLPDVAIQVSAPDDPVYDPARWWRNEQSLVLAVNEVLKLGLYWLEYGISPIG